MAYSTSKDVNLLLCHHVPESVPAIASLVPDVPGTDLMCLELAYVVTQAGSPEDPRLTVGRLQNELFRYASGNQDMLKQIHQSTFIGALVQSICVERGQEAYPILVDVARELDTPEEQELVLQAVGEDAVSAAWVASGGDPQVYIDMRAKAIADSFEFRENHVAQQMIRVSRMTGSPATLIMGANHYSMPRVLEQAGMTSSVIVAQKPDASCEFSLAHLRRVGVELSVGQRALMGLAEWLSCYEGLPESAITYRELRKHGLPETTVREAARIVYAAPNDFLFTDLPADVSKAVQAITRR